MSAFVILVFGNLALFAGSESIVEASAARTSDSIPIVVHSLPPGTVFERYPVGEADSDVTAGANQKLIYSNTFGTFGAAAQAGFRWADDLATSSVPGVLGVNPACRLKRVEFPVLGRVDPLGVGGPYTVNFELFTSCPGSVSQTTGLNTIRIPGSAGQAVFPDDGPRLISLTYPVSLPISNTVWLAVTFSRDNAGMVAGSPAQQGFSCDVYDHPYFACNASFGGFPANAYAAFNVQLFGDATCNDAHVAYRANRPSGPIFNPGAFVPLFDDIELDLDNCQMIAYEIGVRGTGRYTFSLRNQCDSSPIAGTQRTTDASGTDPRILRFLFDPAIAIPRNFYFAASVSNVNSGVIVAGHPACVGKTEDIFQIPNEGGGCWDITPMYGIHSAMNLTITCAGTAPVGACCDMFFADENGESVCRQVPHMNCPFPPHLSGLRPEWVQGAACSPDPFIPHPCGLSACCRPDDVCENLTVNQCNAVPPLDRPRQWQLGLYCEEEWQTCPWNACLAGEGACAFPQSTPGCEDLFCCPYVCNDDPWCCLVEWDRGCVELAGDRCLLARAHDECFHTSPTQGAKPVEADSLTVFNNSAATANPSDPGFCCHWDAVGGRGYGTTWFSFVATDTSARVSTCDSDAAGDSLINVFSVGDPTTQESACASLSMMACSDDVEGCGGGRHGMICVRNLVPGRTYYVMVASKTPESQGLHELDLRSPCFEEPFWNAEDCNENGLQDGCELARKTDTDCNSNRVLDGCDIEEVRSLDCDGDSRPDECTGVLQAFDLSASDSGLVFGVSVALDDTRLIVGEGNPWWPASEAGVIRVFQNTSRGWTLETELHPPIPPSFVALEGPWILAGSDHDSIVYLYHLEGTEWSPAGTLQGPAVYPCQRYGVPLAISGDTVVLASGYCSFELTSESVYVFRHTATGWLEEARLHSPAMLTGDSFGAAVDIRKDRIVVGAPAASAEADGAAYVFRRVGAAWTYEATLVAHEPTYLTLFGARVAIDDVIVVGAMRAIAGSVEDAGAAYVFRRDASSWSLERKLAASDPSAYSLFGFSVDTRGGVIIAGAPFKYYESGAAYVFGRSGSDWIELTKQTAPKSTYWGYFGYAVSMNSTRAAIGAPQGIDFGDYVGRGTAYLVDPGLLDCNQDQMADACELRDGLAADCDSNGLLDECQTLSPADADFDADTDLADLASFMRCYTGPDSTPAAPCCEMFDTPPDGDVDGGDFTAFLTRFQGP